MIYLLAGLASLGIIALWIQIHNFITGERIFCEFLDRLRLTVTRVARWDAYWTRNPCQSDIVVCLTTIPSRIPYIEDTLKSLLYQSRRPRLIRLHVPMFSRREQRFYTIPPYLEALQSLEVVRCEDYGPATKLIPALQAFAPDQKILVVDDDRLYPPTLVDDFHRWSNQHPDVVIGLTGWIVPQDLTHRRTTFWSDLCQRPPSLVKSTRVRKGKQVDVVEGYAGYLVKPEFFDLDRLTDYTGASEAAFFVDDIWFSAHCKAPRYVFPTKRHVFYSWWHQPVFEQTALGPLNNPDDPEQRNNTRMLRYFKDRWMVSDPMAGAKGALQR